MIQEDNQTTQQKILFSFFDVQNIITNGNNNIIFDHYEQTVSDFIQTYNYINNTEKNKKENINYSLEDKHLFDWIDFVKLENRKKFVNESNSEVFNNLIKNKKALSINNLFEFKNLDKTLPNFKEVTEYYLGAFALNQSRSIQNYRAPRPILLLGNPGIGKTYYAKKLANIFQTSYQFLDANSITASFVLSGSSKAWKDTGCGLIFKLMAKSPTISPILLIDEFDKLSSGKNYDPSSNFHQMFEKENAKEFYDEFLEMSFDASNIIYILTANDKNAIAPSLLSRMTVFEIPNPSIEEMKKIIPSIYSDILGNSTLFRANLAKSEIEKLCRYTPREVYQIISSNIYNQASKLTLKNKKIQQNLIIKTLLPSNKKMGF